PSSSNGPSIMERNADYAEELAKLQRQEYEAKDAAARYGYLFSQATAEILSNAGGNLAGSFQPAGSYEPAGQGNSAVSTSVSADFILSLLCVQGINLIWHLHIFPLMMMIFRATLTNLAPAVEVNPVPTKRVNTIHPQSQILGDLASPVLTRSKAQKSKFGEKPTSIAKALEDHDWVTAMQEEMQ
ncbi:hypothetical protein Tco_0767181, partial [Tanacetum coccineum]